MTTFEPTVPTGLGDREHRRGEAGRDPHSFSLLVTVEAGRKRHLSTYSLAGAVQGSDGGSQGSGGDR